MTRYAALPTPLRAPKSLLEHLRLALAPQALQIAHNIMSTLANDFTAVVEHCDHYSALDVDLMLSRYLFCREQI